MQIGLRQFENDVVKWFKTAAGSNDYSRYGLAKELCARAEWRSSSGKYCLTQAYLALPKLAAELGISLPPVRGSRPLEESLPAYDEAFRLDAKLEQLGRISVEPVEPSARRQWRSMMQSCHPLGEPRLPGKALKYWVISEHYRIVGGMSYHAASWHAKARDQHIGWSARARAQNLGLVVNNARFLILPEVRVYGLASAALEAAKSRLVADWHQQYGEKPRLAYTYIDRSYSGQSYRAAGWRQIGETSGRLCSKGQKKQVFALPLAADWKARLCRRSGQRFRPVQDLYLKDDAHWADVEYGASTHPDGRVGKRILSMGRAWRSTPGELTPQIFADEASQKAAYRLLSSDNVNMDDILESHRQATVARCAQRPLVLAVQDSTGLNFDTLKNATSGLTKIGGTAQGIYAHANVAFSPGGRVLGVLDLDGKFRARCAAGGDDLKESVRWIEGLETAAELSAACGAQTRVMTVCDREADVWTLFERQHQLRDQVGLLVRRNGARLRKVIDDAAGTLDLRTHVEALPKVTTRKVKIAAQGGKRARKARTASVALRIAKVQLKAPGKRTDTLPVIAVSVLEERPPARVKEPLNWLLLCSEGEADAANAIRICQWYESRWGIEEYFRVLKSGCRVEKRKFDDVEDLLKCLAFDAITAWRVFDRQRQAKYQPQRLAAEIVDADEPEVRQVLLHQIDRRSPIRPPPQMTILDFVVGLGKLAGFKPSKRQAVPGTAILWKATKKLMISIQAINSYKAIMQIDVNKDDQNTFSSVG